MKFLVACVVIVMLAVSCESAQAGPILRGLRKARHSVGATVHRQAHSRCAGGVCK